MDPQVSTENRKPPKRIGISWLRSRCRDIPRSETSPSLEEHAPSADDCLPTAERDCGLPKDADESDYPSVFIKIRCLLLHSSIVNWLATLLLVGGITIGSLGVRKQTLLEKPDVPAPSSVTLRPTVTDPLPLWPQAPTQEGTFDVSFPWAIPCQRDIDCESGACGSVGHNMTMCCPSGLSMFWPLTSFANYRVCIHQPVGSPCAASKDSCQSPGICNNGMCKSEKVRNGQGCEDNSDCVSGVCVQRRCAAELVPEGGACDDEQDCRNGLSCALESPTQGAKTTCCPAEFVAQPISTLVCKAQPAGTRCGIADTLCASGVCFRGFCLAAKQPVGEPCDTNSHCMANNSTCVEGSCTKGLVPPAESCDDDQDCAENNPCALETLTGNSTRVCCSSGGSAYLWAPISNTVCTGQGTGSPCSGSSSHSICSSGECISSGFCK